jgi:hypothetical protein
MKKHYSFIDTVYGMIPAGGIEIRYSGEAEILFSDINEEFISGIEILSVVVTVNGKNDPFATLPSEEVAPLFYEKAREAVRKEWFEMRCEIQ